MADIKDAFRLLRGLSTKEKEQVDAVMNFISKKAAKTLKTLVKQKRVKIETADFHIPGSERIKIPKLVCNDEKEDRISSFVNKVNNKIDSCLKKKSMNKFTESTIDKISKEIAPNIIGFENIKKATALQLFSPEQIHILLLGDPGTGKTKIIKSAAEFHPISAFGLGSGTSGAGLAITIKGGEVVKGLLPSAHQGLCAIDELNLMKEESRASLYSAMEDGFVSYNKGGHSYRLDARVSVIATANPKGDKFKGKKIAELKKQMPFDSALLTRFHLVFLIRKPKLEEFKKISANILQQKEHKTSKSTIKFIKDYIAQALEIDVHLPGKYEDQIIEFIAGLKQNEKNFLIEISPRFVNGFKRLVKAAARSELRDTVEQNDIDLIKEILGQSLVIG